MEASRGIALPLIVAAAGLSCADLEPAREDHFLDRSECLARLAQIQIGLDRLRPVLVAAQGKSFQLGRQERIAKHVAIVASRLPPKPTSDELQAAAVGINLAGMAYDVVRLDAAASIRGLGGVAHRTSAMRVDELFRAMDALEADPTWANREVESARRLIYQVALHRDNVRDALGMGEGMRAGVNAAAITNGAVGIIELSTGGATAFLRIIQFIKAGGSETAAFSAAAVGSAGSLTVHVVAAGRSLALTEAELASLVGAGVLSAASWNLVMMANGEPKKTSPNSFAAWVKSRPTRGVSTTREYAKYQAKHCGPTEYLASSDNGDSIWADGVSSQDAYLREAKYVENPERSPFVPESKLDAKVRKIVKDQQLDQMRKYASVIRDPRTPVVGLEIVTNDVRAAPYFEDLLREAGIAGRVVVQP